MGDQNETNNIKVYNHNFLPSLEIALLRDAQDNIETLLNHQIGEVFEIDEKNLRNPRYKLEKLFKYFRIQIKVRKRTDGVETIYKTMMVPCTEEHFKMNNFIADESLSKNYF